MLTVNVLALDVGDARIGIALGTMGSKWVFGRGYLVRTALAADLDGLTAKAQQENAKRFVVGLPLRTDGTESAQQLRVMPIADGLKERGFEVVFQDERFTTKLGQARLMNAPKRVRQEKGKLDEAAAVAILESYLEMQ